MTSTSWHPCRLWTTWLTQRQIQDNFLIFTGCIFKIPDVKNSPGPQRTTPVGTAEITNSTDNARGKNGPFSLWINIWNIREVVTEVQSSSLQFFPFILFKFQSSKYSRSVLKSPLYRWEQWRVFKITKGVGGIDLTKRACSMSHSIVWGPCVCWAGCWSWRGHRHEAMWMHQAQRGSLPGPLVSFPLCALGWLNHTVLSSSKC